MFDIKKKSPGSTLGSKVPGRRRSSFQSVMALLLLSVFVAGCETFAGVVKAEPEPVKLSVFVPARPAPILPVNPTLFQMTNETAKQLTDEGLPFSLTAMTIEDGNLLLHWILAVNTNQREWHRYADYWENRFKEPVK